MWNKVEVCDQRCVCRCMHEFFSYPDGETFIHVPVCGYVCASIGKEERL